MKVFDRTLETKENQIIVWGLERLLQGLGTNIDILPKKGDDDKKEKPLVSIHDKSIDTVNLTFLEDSEIEFEVENQKPLQVDEVQDMMREMNEVQQQIFSEKVE